jgi:hypothetical protein
MQEIKRPGRRYWRMSIIQSKALAYLPHNSLISGRAMEIHELYGYGARKNIDCVYERDIY